MNFVGISQEESVQILPPEFEKIQAFQTGLGVFPTENMTLL